MAYADAHRDRAATAWHEAGHVVAAEILGNLYLSVSIEPDEDSVGRVISEGIDRFFDDPDPNPREVHRIVIELMAGAAAQKLHDARSYRQYQGRRDREAILRALSLLYSGPDLRRRWRHLHRATDRLVRRRQVSADIERVAKALLHQNTIDGQVVQVLVALRGITWEQIAPHLNEGPLDGMWLYAIYSHYQPGGA